MGVLAGEGGGNIPWPRYFHMVSEMSFSYSYTSPTDGRGFYKCSSLYILLHSLEKNMLPWQKPTFTHE